MSVLIQSNRKLHYWDKMKNKIISSDIELQNDLKNGFVHEPPSLEKIKIFK